MRSAFVVSACALALAVGCGGASTSNDPGVPPDAPLNEDDLAADAADGADRDTLPEATPDFSHVGVDSLGGCTACGLGSLVGLTCAPDGKTPVAEVRITIDTFDCDGQPLHLETLSDVKGQYRIDGVPCGIQTVNLVKGSYQHQYNVSVDAGIDNELANGRCFGPKSAKIAVILGDWDHIQTAILQKLKLPWTQFNGFAQDKGGYEEAEDLLTDPAKLGEFNVLFINCSDGMDQMMASNGWAVAQTLDAWVKKGGSVYASDYAGAVIMGTWPDAIDWGGRSIGRETVFGVVQDPPLIGYLGYQNVTLSYVLGPLQALATQTNPDTLTHIIAQFKQLGPLPTMVSFRPHPNGGRVVYTNFHNEEQEGQALADLVKILSYIVFML